MYESILQIAKMTVFKQIMQNKRVSNELNNESPHVALTEDGTSYANVCFNH